MRLIACKLGRRDIVSKWRRRHEIGRDPTVALVALEAED
jgi:hypothetical protein